MAKINPSLHLIHLKCRVQGKLHVDTCIFDKSSSMFRFQFILPKYGYTPLLMVKIVTKKVTIVYKLYMIFFARNSFEVVKTLMKLC